MTDDKQKQLGKTLWAIAENGRTQIKLRADRGTVWLAQLETAELYQTAGA